MSSTAARKQEAAKAFGVDAKTIRRDLGLLQRLGFDLVENIEGHGRKRWRVLAVVGMGTGVGLLVWGIIIAAAKEEPLIGSPAGIIATGAGVLASAIVLLVISFFGGRTGRKE